jgi:mRNA-degrading endonuclease toxin of MazEF toxin-antitoxin module
MPVNRGDVVLVPVPDTSGAPGKTRPALVVSSDHNNRRLQDAIVAVITGTTSQAQLEPTQLLIELATPEGRGVRPADRFGRQVRAPARHSPKPDPAHRWLPVGAGHAHD